jgi:hypothetical protein
MFGWSSFVGLHPLLSACQRCLQMAPATFYFGQKIPEHFFDMFHQFIYYRGQLEGAPQDCDAAIYQHGLTAMNRLEENFNMKDVAPLIRVKLLFVCNQDFDDPYRPGQPGYQYTSYPHESDNVTPFFVFSVSMKELAALVAKLPLPMLLMYGITSLLRRRRRLHPHHRIHQMHQLISRYSSHGTWGIPWQ